MDGDQTGSSTQVPTTRRGRLMLYGGRLAAVLAAVASAVAIWGFFFRTPQQTPERYEGDISSSAEQQAFVDFTTAHAREIVRLEVWMAADTWPETEEKGSSEVSYFTVFFDCPPGVATPSVEAGCTGMEYQVTIDPSGDASIYYNQGANYLDGYFTVRPNAGSHQGILSTSLIAVRTEDVR
jgi:hypothetical protein